MDYMKCCAVTSFNIKCCDVYLSINRALSHTHTQKSDAVTSGPGVQQPRGVRQTRENSGTYHDQVRALLSLSPAQSSVKSKKQKSR